MVGTGAELSSFECIEMAVFNAASLTASYQVMNGASQQADTGSVGFQDDIKILKVYNDGSTGVTISFDGVVKHDYLPSKGTMIIDLQTNHANAATGGQGTKNGRKGQLVYGKGTASSAGLNIYISGFR